MSDFFRGLSTAELVVVFLTASILGVSFLFFGLAVTRRIRNARRYRRLDRLRVAALEHLRQVFASGALPDGPRDFDMRPGSLEWVAVEDSLFTLLEEDSGRRIVPELFSRLGYVSYYEAELSRRSAIRKSLAIDKLGRMGSRSSLPLLVPMLDVPNRDVVSVAVRAVCRIGERDALKTMLGRIPVLLDKELVSTKTVAAALLCCDPTLSGTLLDYGKSCGDPRLLALVLDVMQSLPAGQETNDFATGQLGHGDPEVRAKALKVLAVATGGCLPQPIVPLLRDPVWFVRLQAVRALGMQECREAAPEMGALVLDEKWQVRTAAALALTKLGEAAIDVFWELLKSTDRYAKESICEEMQKTGFVELLLRSVGSDGNARAAKALDILTVMASLNFTTPLRTVVEREGDSGLARRMTALLAEVKAA